MFIFDGRSTFETWSRKGKIEEAAMVERGDLLESTCVTLIDVLHRHFTILANRPGFSPILRH